MEILGATSVFAEVARRVFGVHEPQKYGLKTYQDPPDPEVHIIFVHGLRADSASAWSEKDVSTGETFCWPESELLPSHLSVRARIAMYDYDSKFRTPEYLTRRTLLHQTSHLIKDLVSLRQDYGPLPIIFVCHSIGGIIVKNALIGARTSETPELIDVCDATKGIVFLGTPHSASPTDLADSISRIVWAPDGKVNDRIDKELRNRSETLGYSLECFKPLAARLTIYAFLETGTDKNTRLLEQGHSSLSDTHHVLSTHRDLASICKFSTAKDEDLKNIIGAVRTLCKQAKRSRTESSIESGAREQERAVSYSEGPILRTIEGEAGGDAEIGVEAQAKNGRESQTADEAGSNAESSAEDEVAETSAMPEVGILQTFFDKWSKRPDPKPDPKPGPKRSVLSFLSRWRGEVEAKDPPAGPKDGWPVAVLRGPLGCGKTATALEYARQQRERYGLVLWINASTRKSIEFSFRIAEHKIGLSPDHRPAAIEADRLPQEDRQLDDDELYRLVQRVTEWLERRQDKKWLLVIDDLSRDSPYPTQPVSTRVRSTRRTWRELLRIIPSVTGWHGHVIFCTSDGGDIGGPKIITLASPELPSQTDTIKATSQPDISATGIPSSVDPARRLVERWRESSNQHAQSRFALALIVSDKECPHIPLSLLGWDDELSTSALDDFAVSYDQYNEPYATLPDYLFQEGLSALVDRTSNTASGELVISPDLDGLPGNTSTGELDISPDFDGSSTIVERTSNTAFGELIMSPDFEPWTLLSKSIASLRDKYDPVFGWKREARLVGNVGAAIRRWRQFAKHATMTHTMPSLQAPNDVDYHRIVSFCEDHAAFRDAGRLAEFMLQQCPREASEYVDLQLDCIRLYFQGEQDDEAKRMYRDIVARPDLPLRSRMEASRQLASWHASHGRYAEAVDVLSRALECEDPFGADAQEGFMIKPLSDLAAYLTKTGNWPSASALLQRVVVSLEDTRGRGDLATLSTIERLSEIKQTEGELHKAKRLLSVVYEAQRQRLGELHPFTVLSWSKVAAVVDLGGDRREAETIYHTCLRRATDSLGPRHPYVFGIRENLARCLLAQGKKDEAKAEFETLQDELRALRGLYSSAVERRISHMLAGTGMTAADYELDLQLSKRNTLGIGDLEEDEDSASSEDDGYQFSDEEETDEDEEMVC